MSSFPVSDEFNDPIGWWDGWAPWDSSYKSRSNGGFTATQFHVDLRNFNVITLHEPRPQVPDLDTDTDQAFWESGPQTDMEVRTSTTGELWTLDTTAGVTSLTVGKSSTRGGWSRLKLTTTGAAVDTTIRSSIPGDGIDISTMIYLSLILPDYNSFDTNSSIILTSSTTGGFGGTGDSATVSFSANASVMPHLKLALSAFTNSGFDPTRVTGVKIRLRKAVAPAGSLTVTLMALRALSATWAESALDFNTIDGTACVPVTLDGAAYSGTTAQAFEFIRGDGTKDDPVPADGTYYVYFNPGGATSPNDATGVVYNTIAFFLREEKDLVADTGSYIAAKIKWNDAGTLFSAYRADFAASVETDTAGTSSTIPVVLDPAQNYLAICDLVGTTLTATLYAVNTDRSLVTPAVWSSGPISLADFKWRSGRVGLMMDLKNRDAYVDAYEAAATGYAILRTKVSPSYTPVRSVQLAATFSTDVNLCNEMIGLDMAIDTTKTTSGSGSVRSQSSLISNQFLIDDWTQTYAQLDIWVSGAVTPLNQPEIRISTTAVDIKLKAPDLQPNQWNSLYFDLGNLRYLLTANPYRLSVQAATAPDRPLGFFWVDSVLVARRRISWAARATEHGPFREFKSLVNDAQGALHFGAEERGRSLQLEARALTDDAWIAPNIKLFVHYAELGLPVYDDVHL